MIGPSRHRVDKAAYALWALGDGSTAADVSSLVGCTIQEAFHALIALEEEGVASRAPTNPVRWSFLRPRESEETMWKASNILWNSAEPMGAPELARAVGVRTQQAHTVLKRLEDKGVLEAVRGDGRVYYSAKGARA